MSKLKSPLQQVAPSLLSADFARLGEIAMALERAGATRLHIDVMDGHFVPALTIGPKIVQSLRKISSLPLDLHLMVQKPENLIPDFISAGAHSITIHIETAPNPTSLLKQIRKHNVSAGLTLKPATPLKSLFPYLALVDLVLIMTVEPGKGGQSLLKSQVPKIKLVKQEMLRQGLKLKPIHVDGGVNDKTLPLLSFADILVSGHFILHHKKGYAKAISLLKKPTRHKKTNR